jgi:hypothetical protein
LLSLGHFAPPMDFWLDMMMDELLEWCEALNELLEPKDR